MNLFREIDMRNVRVWAACFVILLIAGSVFFKLAKRANLLLGFEKERVLVVETVQGHSGGKNTWTYELTFTDKDGHHYHQWFDKEAYETLKTGPDQEIKVVIDGLLWNAIVKVDQGDGYRSVYP